MHACSADFLALCGWVFIIEMNNNMNMQSISAFLRYLILAWNANTAAAVDDLKLWLS